MNFDDYFRLASDHFESKDFVSSRALYLKAISVDSLHEHSLLAAVRVELIDEIVQSKEWYGEDPPKDHAICIFGSVGSSWTTHPYIHNVQFGKRAYDANHTAHYMDELVRQRKFRTLLQPSFLLLYFAMLSISSDDVEFNEIGASLYSAYEKLENVKNFIGDFKAPKINYLGVELSERLRWVAQALHQNASIEMYSTWQSVPTPRHPRFSFSLGVANYAFCNSDELVQWLAQSRVTILREKFSTNGDLIHSLLGKRFVCFDGPGLVKRMGSLGYKVAVLSCAESAPFLNEPVQLENSRYFNAYLMVHNLNDIEVQRLETLFARHRIERVPPNIDADPPVRLSPGIVSKSIELAEALKHIEWSRNYMRPKTRGVFGRFNFNQINDRPDFAAHKMNISKIYNLNSSTQKTSVNLARLKTIMKALVGDRSAISAIVAKIRRILAG